jgi:hypothetical protein
MLLLRAEYRTGRRVPVTISLFWLGRVLLAIYDLEASVNFTFFKYFDIVMYSFCSNYVL